ncbi:MAG: radical SAM protein [Treponema sp.]|jgi:threonylcarbamoyladenosine tRNA methylthiotransferase MtaB|nr:radical SAM protein [Treponema sp.]
MEFPRSVSFYTLGCKLNQLETEAVAAAFREEGFALLPWNGSSGVPRDQGPELLVVNTCTVTSRAEQKARRIIRLFLRTGGTVVVTGCYAQLNRAELCSLAPDTGGSLFVVPGRAKDRLLDLPRFLARSGGTPRELLARWCSGLDGSAAAGEGPFAGEPSLASAGPDSAVTGGMAGPSASAAFRFNPRNFLFHSRGFLKIQDGCDRRCAYCRVPLARGGSVSLEAPELARRLRALEEAGISEAVLTGVNICQYRDPASSGALPELLGLLLDKTRRIALRLSSIEPEPEGTFLKNPGFSVLSHPRIRPHFHLSVQSGSDRILAAMGRPYTGKDVLRTAERLRSVKNDPFLGCDIIAGFPGERDEDFEKTAALCRDAEFAFIHGFPYSKRPGTPAADMKDQVRRGIAEKRLDRLRELSLEAGGAYLRRWQGKTLDAVAENPPGNDHFSPFFPALTDNYIRLLVSAGTGEVPKSGSSFRCRIGEALPRAGVKQSDFDAWGEIVYSNRGEQT